MSWLIYVRGLRVLTPQVVEDGQGGPFIDEGIRGLVVGAPILLKDSDHGLSLGELEQRYPAPKMPEPAE